MRRYWRKRLWRSLCRLARPRARERGFWQPYAAEVREGPPGWICDIKNDRGRDYIALPDFDGEA
jgi:hypothetical protein